MRNYRRKRRQRNSFERNVFNFLFCVTTVFLSCKSVSMSDISEIIDNAIISKNMQVKNNTLQYAKKVFTEQNKINTTNEKKIKSMSTWAVMGKIFLALDIIILLIIGGIIVLKIMK